MPRDDRTDDDGIEPVVLEHRCHVREVVVAPQRLACGNCGTLKSVPHYIGLVHRLAVPDTIRKDDQVIRDESIKSRRQTQIGARLLDNR